MEKKFLYIFSVQKITFHIFSDFYQLDITYLSNKDKTSRTSVLILKKIGHPLQDSLFKFIFCIRLLFSFEHRISITQEI